MVVTKIISGGQIGADQGGLFAAKQLGLETGGFAPPHYETLAGTNAPLLRDTYGLQEITASPRQKYPIRSQMNVTASDATVVFWLRPSPGTDCTVNYAVYKQWKRASQHYRKPGDIRARLPPNCQPYRPLFIVTDPSCAEQQRNFREFVCTHHVRVLNVAGHSDRTLHDAAATFLIAALKSE